MLFSSKILWGRVLTRAALGEEDDLVSEEGPLPRLIQSEP